MIYLNDFKKYNENIIVSDVLITENFKDIKIKIINYLKKGILTSSILLSLFSNLNAQEQKEIINIIKKEDIELYDIINNNYITKELKTESEKYEISLNFGWTSGMGTTNSNNISTHELRNINIRNNNNSISFYHFNIKPNEIKIIQQYSNFLEFLSRCKYYFEKWKKSANENNIKEINKLMPISFQKYHCNFIIYDNITFIVITDGNPELTNNLKFTYKHLHPLDKTYDPYTMKVLKNGNNQMERTIKMTKIMADITESLYFWNTNDIQLFIDTFSMNEIENIINYRKNYIEKINNIFEIDKDDLPIKHPNISFDDFDINIFYQGLFSPSVTSFNSEFILLTDSNGIVNKIETVYVDDNRYRSRFIKYINNKYMNTKWGYKKLKIKIELSVNKDNKILYRRDPEIYN